MGQRHRDADRAVAAHAQVADVVEEDDARGGRTGRPARGQGADHHVRAARLVDDGRAERVVTVAEDGQALGHRAGAELGAARDDHAGRLAAGVGVDHLDAMHGHPLRLARSLAMRLSLSLRRRLRPASRSTGG